LYAVVFDGVVAAAAAAAV